MISTRLKEFLDENGVSYDVIRHDPAFTTQRTAAEMHVSGYELAKVVVVKLNGQFALAAVQGPHVLDLEALADIAGVSDCSLASEEEFQRLFPDCEVGAMPPFGNLYDLPTFVDRALAEQDSIVFDAGSHAEALRLPYADLARLADARVGRFAIPETGVPVAKKKPTKKKQPAKKKKKPAKKKKAKKKPTKKKAAKKKKAKKKKAKKKKAATKKRTKKKKKQKKKKKAARKK